MNEPRSKLIEQTLEQGTLVHYKGIPCLLKTRTDVLCGTMLHKPNKKKWIEIKSSPDNKSEDDRQKGAATNGLSD